MVHQAKDDAPFLYFINLYNFCCILSGMYFVLDFDKIKNKTIPYYKIISLLLTDAMSRLSIL